MSKEYSVAKLPEAISSKIQIAESGCWDWVATKNSCGYGQISLAGKMLYAHRLVFELLVNEIPIGLTLDHLCRNRKCVNPRHLEPVTVRENTLRGSGPSAINAIKKACIHGHEFTPENTCYEGRKRRCRKCRLVRVRRHRARIAELEAEVKRLKELARKMAECYQTGTKARDEHGKAAKP